MAHVLLRGFEPGGYCTQPVPPRVRSPRDQARLASFCWQTRGVNVVLKFDSEQAARNWYNDPAYAPVRQVRLDSTRNGSIMMAREFKPPAAWAPAHAAPRVVDFRSAGLQPGTYLPPAIGVAG